MLRNRQPALASPGTVVWLNVSGVWKQCIVWLNVSGVWKQTNVYLNVSGTWK